MIIKVNDISTVTSKMWWTLTVSITLCSLLILGILQD